MGSNSGYLKKSFLLYCHNSKSTGEETGKTHLCALLKGASLVCKDWLQIIRNDPHLSSEFLTTAYLGYKDINSLLQSFPILHTIQFRTTSYKHKNFGRIDFESAANLKKVILVIGTFSDDKEDIFTPPTEKSCPKKRKTSIDNILEPIENILNVKQIVFNPKEKLSVSVENIRALELHKYSSYVSYRNYFAADSLKNLEVLHIHLHMHLISLKENQDRLSEMLKNLSILKHLEIELLEDPLHDHNFNGLTVILQSCSQIISLTIHSLNTRNEHTITGKMTEINQLKMNSISRCLELFKDLKKLELNNYKFKPGIKIDPLLYCSNSVRELVLGNCKFFPELLNSFVGMFPNLESLELKYCSSNRLSTQKYFPPGTLLKHITILSGLKNLKNLKLIHSYCEAENEWNFTKVIASVTEKAILCLKGRVSVQGVESLWGDCRFIPADWRS